MTQHEFTVRIAKEVNGVAASPKPARTYELSAFELGLVAGGGNDNALMPTKR
jgi:hypothetical protein